MIILVSFISCRMNTYELKNNLTKVPYDKSVYKNKINFDKELLKVVDTSVVYEEFSVKYNVLKRLDSHIENRFYGVYRFYSNGYLNLFYLDRQLSQSVNDFNPDYNGYRGVYYKEEGKIKSDLFSIINDWGWAGRIKETYSFVGDTLYVKNDKPRSNTYKYVKRKLPIEYLKYKADW